MIRSSHLDKLTTRGQESIDELNKEVKAGTTKVPTEASDIKEESSQQKNKFTPKSIMKAVETMNKELEPSGKKLAYSIHERTNQILIKVIDIETNEVIKEIPDEKLMDMMADFCEASGILIDEKI